MSRSRSRLLRYRIDVLSVLVVVAALAAQLAALLLAMPWFTVLPILVLMRWQHLVAHNHCHLPIFWSRPLNEVLGWAMFLSGGVPLEAYRVFHADTHHRYTHRDGDWTSPFSYQGARFPDRPVGLLHYVLTYSLLSLCHVVIELFTRPGSPALRRFLISIAVVGAACAALIHHDPWRFLLFFYLPWCVVYFLAPLANWYQHHRCAFTDPYTSANINLSVSAARSASTSAITPPIT